VLAESLSISPSSGSITGGYDITISSLRIDNGADVTYVSLVGTPAVIKSQSTTTVIVTAGIGTVGTGDAIVTSTALGTATLKNSFTYLRTFSQTINPHYHSSYNHKCCAII